MGWRPQRDSNPCCRRERQCPRPLDDGDHRLRIGSIGRKL